MASMMIIQAFAQLCVLSCSMPLMRTNGPLARIAPPFQHMLWKPRYLACSLGDSVVT